MLGCFARAGGEETDVFRRSPVVFAAIGFMLAGNAAAVAACSPASSGEKKADLCSGSTCRSFAAPKEIADIRRGIYSEYVGLFVNDGYARWVGLDLDRSEMVEVQRFAGKQLPAAVKQLRKMKQSANHYKRETRSAKLHIIDVVHKKPADRSAIGDLICAANGLWAEVSDPKLGPFQVVPASDSHNKLYLLDRGAVKDFGGPGELTEAPRRLRESLDALQKRI